jgi:hypothetical protein
MEFLLRTGAHQPAGLRARAVDSRGARVGFAEARSGVDHGWLRGLAPTLSAAVATCGVRRFAKRRSASRPSSSFLVNPFVFTISAATRVGRRWLWRRFFVASQGQSSGQWLVFARLHVPQIGRSHSWRPASQRTNPARHRSSTQRRRYGSEQCPTLRGKGPQGRTVAQGCRQFLRLTRLKCSPSAWHTRTGHVIRWATSVSVDRRLLRYD